MADVTVSAGEYTVPAGTFTAPEGKVFDKWDRGSVGTTITLNNHLTLVAQWRDVTIKQYTISFDTDDLTNRALSVDVLNKKATKTFAVGDQIAVFFVDGKGRSMRALSDALTIDDIHNDGKSADFTVNFLAWSGASPGDDTQVRYVYPANMAKGSIEDNAEINDANTIDYSNLAYQTGDLDYLGEAYDLAVFDGNFSDGNLPALAIFICSLLLSISSWAFLISGRCAIAAS